MQPIYIFWVTFSHLEIKSFIEHKLRQVVKQIVNIRKIINLLFTSFTLFSKCLSLKYAKLQSQITDQKMPRSDTNRRKFQLSYARKSPVRILFSKKFSTSNCLFHNRVHSVKFIRNASYINRKGLSCLPQLSKQIIQWIVISRLKKKHSSNNLGANLGTDLQQIRRLHNSKQCS